MTNTKSMGFMQPTPEQMNAAKERIASRRSHGMNERTAAEAVITKQEQGIAATKQYVSGDTRTPMTFAEWQSLRRENVHKYSREYRFMAEDQIALGENAFFGRPEPVKPKPKVTSSVFDADDLDDQLDPVDFDSASATADPEEDV